MIAEIISVGTELLLGDILNTNAQFLSKQLAELGINVYYQTTVGDNENRLQQAINLAKSRCDLLVFSGGLGPTDDDLTKMTVAKAFNDDLVLNVDELKRIESFFACSGKEMPKNNTKQARLPKNGRTLKNENGTAPGAIFTDKDKYAVVLPGPPSECEPMFLGEVKPWLAEMCDSALASEVLHICGIGESALEEKIKKYLDEKNPTTAVYAKIGEVHIRVTAKADTADKAKNIAQNTVKQLKSELGDFVYTDQNETLAECVVRLLNENRKVLASAESCTGGLVAKMITDVPGASKVFNYGACTYTPQIKESVLNVKKQTIEEFGVVSVETAKEMAKGILDKSGADYAIGVTGVAGPGADDRQNPAGLVYIAVADNKRVVVHKMMLVNRTRQTVRTVATIRALDMLRRIIINADMSAYL